MARVSEDARILVISGPNTGEDGFSQDLGLCAAMARAGLCSPSLPVQKFLFSVKYLVISGIHSPFPMIFELSGHITHLNGHSDTWARPLVLLDELFSGTDPVQGAALRAALLELLVQRQAVVGVTTHFRRLKHYALESAACVGIHGFDLTKLEPTYHLQSGVPGSSYALGIARRLGFPSEIIDTAERMLTGEETASLQEMIEELQRRRKRQTVNVSLCSSGGYCRSQTSQGKAGDAKAPGPGAVDAELQGI